MVEGPTEELEWERCYPSPTRHGNRDRCLNNRMGSSVLGSQNRRALVLSAARLAVQTFAKDGLNTPRHIHLRMDNVSNGGNTFSRPYEGGLFTLGQRGITLSASHLPGLDNVIADQESREIQTSAEWMLHKELFLTVNRSLGPCSTDLFAS